MVNAQEWLEENYPKEGVCLINYSTDKGKKRSEITNLRINYESFQGILDFSDFINLETLDYEFNYQPSQLILPQNKQLRRLDCRHSKLTNLDISNNSSLTYLNCEKNQLKSLILTKSNKLEWITLSNNYLTNFSYEKLNPNNLTSLYLLNNNLESIDISVFSQLVNLTNLLIGNDNDWVKSGKFNKFFGSLEALNKCTELIILDINNTNIDSGLEYLSDKLWNFNYSSLSSYNFKVQEIELEIAFFNQDWKTLISWKRQGLSFEEIKKLINHGLNKYEFNFAKHLKNNDYSPKNKVQPEIKAQDWLDFYYPQEGVCIKKKNIQGKDYENYNKKRSEITELDLSEKKFIESLDLTEFDNLEVLNINHNPQIDIELIKLPESLTKFSCQGTKYEKELKPYGGSIQGWREAYKRDQEIKQLEEENIKIEGLEDDIVRLTNLTNEQRIKIVNAYLKFAPEKEFLKGLINLQLEFTKFKRTHNDTSDYNDKCEEYEEVIQEIKRELKKNVSKEEMNEVRNILSDCEILVQWELELENEIIRRKLLLNDAYQKVTNLEISIGKIEAHDNSQIYIGNIIRSHKLDKYNDYHSISNLTEIMNEINLTNNFDIVNNKDKSTNYLGSEVNYYQEIPSK